MKLTNEDGYVEKADFIKCCQVMDIRKYFNTLPTTFCLKDMKLLDFTGRKVDPSLMMGFKETKKDEDPNVKVL